MHGSNGASSGSPESITQRWKDVFSSVVGRSHGATGISCQDYAYCKQYKDYVIGAVSDGAGSCSLSEHGSRLAVETTLEYFTTILENSRLNPFLSENDTKRLFRELISAIRVKIDEKAVSWSSEYNQKYIAGDFACTLLAFVAFPEGIAAMQLGDGFIVIRDRESKEYNLLFLSTKDEDQPTNYTTFVTSSAASIQKDLQIIYRPQSISFICASTDGLEKLAIDPFTQKAYARFFIPLEKYIQKTPYPKQDSYIEEFLNLDDVNNNKNEDDKTILICVDINADPAPELPLITSTFEPPKPLPPTTTKPPSVGIPKNRDSLPPSSSPNPVTKKPEPVSTTLEQPELETFENTSGRNVKRRHPRRLIGLLLFSNFLCLYFATVSAIYIVEKIHQNRPDLVISINIASQQLSFGSIPIFIAGAYIVVLFLYCLLTPRLHTFSYPSNLSKRITKRKNSKSSNKLSNLSYIIMAIRSIRFDKIIAVCLPIIAVILAFITASSLNNTFPNIAKLEGKHPPTASPATPPPKSDSGDKSTSSKDTGKSTPTSKPNPPEKPGDSKDDGTTNQPTKDNDAGSRNLQPNPLSEQTSR